mmetsp:Transcript_8272/g.4421  ORF Transcript_8272/g.4421 Transcript_8272/m.4421 type:complete len:92 (-) Transcript_8272:658-933(-)
MFEMSSMGNPPSGVRLTIEVICHYMKVDPVMIPNPDGKGKSPDYWAAAKKDFLKAPDKLLKNLIKYDKDNIDPHIINKVLPYISRSDFEYE